MKRISAPTAQQGMALLEALIAMLIFSFGVLGIVALQAKASQFSVDSEDRTRAALLANEIVSQMWAAGSTADCSSLAASTVSDRSDLGLPGVAVSCTSNSSSSSSSASSSGSSSSSSAEVNASKVVVISVTWKAPWRKSTEQSNTYVTKVVMP